MVFTVWRLGEVETQQVIRFRTVFSVAHHQFASFSTTKTEVLVREFSLQPELPLLRLHLGVLCLLLFLRHHSTLEKKKKQYKAKLKASNAAFKLVFAHREETLDMREGGESRHRWLYSEESRAVVRSAVTGHPPVAHTVQVVVEGQLCACGTTPHSKCSFEKQKQAPRSI